MIQYASKYARRFVVDLKLRETRKQLDRSRALIRKAGGTVLEYNRLMEPKRKELHDRISGIYSQFTPRSLHLSLICFSAIGVKMVEKAPDWLRSWGEGLVEQGFPELGRELIQHAREETGHDAWHRRDVTYLVRRFNERYGTFLCEEEILPQSPISCVVDYQELSEGLARDKTPSLCLAELFETELMAADLAPGFIGYCAQELGFGIMKGLNFLRGHVVSDIDHIHENIHQMSLFLEKRPETLQEMVRVGRKTVDIYIDYFEKALSMGVALDQKLRAVPRNPLWI